VAGRQNSKKFKTGKSECINLSMQSKKTIKEKHPIVTVERDWKEYLGECLLIVFSVILALGVTEFINNLNEKKKINEVLHQLKEELIANRQAEKEQYAYHLLVLKRIDSALVNPVLSQKFISNGIIHLEAITPPPHGVLLHDLNDVAWQVAKQNNIISKIDLTTYSLLNDIYNNQQRITGSEKEIANVLLSRESRTTADNHVTLLLLHDNYLGWDIQRAPNLLNLYQKAIDKLSKY